MSHRKASSTLVARPMPGFVPPPTLVVQQNGAAASEPSPIGELQQQQQQQQRSPVMGGARPHLPGSTPVYGQQQQTPVYGQQQQTPVYGQQQQQQQQQPDVEMQGVYQQATPSSKQPLVQQAQTPSAGPGAIVVGGVVGDDGYHELDENVTTPVSRPPMQPRGARKVHPTSKKPGPRGTTMVTGRGKVPIAAALGGHARVIDHAWEKEKARREKKEKELASQRTGKIAMWVGLVIAAADFITDVLVARGMVTGLQCGVPKSVDPSAPEGSVIESTGNRINIRNLGITLFCISAVGVVSEIVMARRRMKNFAMKFNRIVVEDVGSALLNLYLAFAYVWFNASTTSSLVMTGLSLGFSVGKEQLSGVINCCRGFFCCKLFRLKMACRDLILSVVAIAAIATGTALIISSNRSPERFFVVQWREQSAGAGLNMTVISESDSIPIPTRDDEFTCRLKCASEFGWSGSDNNERQADENTDASPEDYELNFICTTTFRAAVSYTTRWELVPNTRVTRPTSFEWKWAHRNTQTSPAAEHQARYNQYKALLPDITYFRQPTACWLKAESDRSGEELPGD